MNKIKTLKIITALNIFMILSWGFSTKPKKTLSYLEEA